MALELQPITIVAIVIGSLALVILLIALTARYGRVLFTGRSPDRSDSLARAHAPHLSANRYSKSTFATLGGVPVQPRIGATPTPTTAASTLVGTPVSKLVKKTPTRPRAESPAMPQGRREGGLRPEHPDKRESQQVVVFTYEDGLRRLGLPPPDLFGGGGVSPVRNRVSPASPVDDGLSPIINEPSRPSPRPYPGRAALGQWETTTSEKSNRHRGEAPAGVSPMDLPPAVMYPVGQLDPPNSPAQTMRSNWLPTYYFSSGVPADEESELEASSRADEETELGYRSKWPDNRI